MPFKRSILFWCIAVLFLMCPSRTGFGQVRFLEQNWDEATRQEFYSMSQGSRMMPYDWFTALEVSGGSELLASSRLYELGYLCNTTANNNVGELPLGFVLDEHPISKERFVGLTCAACHTGQVEHQGVVYQVDGAPASADMWQMLNDVNDSLIETRRDDLKFKRFATRVLGGTANEQSVKALRRQLVEFADYWKQFIDASRTQHTWDDRESMHSA